MKLSPLIEAQELLTLLHHPDVLIFDTSNGPNAKANYDAEHIKGAYYVDLNTQLAEIQTDLANGGRHPLPSPESFAKTLTALGVSKNNHIILYDDKNGSNASARFWWMLTAAGLEKVQVLNGGFIQAKKNNLPTHSKTEPLRNTNEPYSFNKWNLPLIEIEEVEKIASLPNYMIIDVRDHERYLGNVEPIDSVAGHIPGAINIPFTENMDANGLFLTREQLRKNYESLLGSIKPENIAVHCGSGVTACHTLLALAYAELPIPKLYVGSWSEWSRNNKTIGKGPE